MKTILFFFGILSMLAISYAEVPEHEPSWDSNCPEGFQWSRGTAACEQADCPEGAGRTYTYECNCGEAWNQPFRTCYDPERSGYAIACVAAGEPCPGEGSDEPTAENCDYDSDCPTGYVCNPSTNRCEQLGPESCTTNSDCQMGYECKISSHQCREIEEDGENCDDLICDLTGGECVNGECIDKCLNVTCEDSCSYGTQKIDGECQNITGECVYKNETDCKNGCSSFGTRCILSIGNADFIDADGIVRPLKNLKVEAVWYDELMVEKTKLPVRYTNEDGSIDFTDNELDMYENGTLEIVLIFEDENRLIQVVDANGLSANASDAQRIALAVASDHRMVDVNLDGHLNLTYTSADSAAIYAKVYYHSIEAAEFMTDELMIPMKHGPERVYVNDPITTGAFHNGGSTSGTSDKGISIGVADSVFNNSNSPTNLEWHEFGHHIMYEVYGYHLCCDSVNHGGYNNPQSIDSYTEGFAEFMSMMMLDYYNYPKKNLYFVGSTPYDMEINYRVGSSAGGMQLEETALASIYYDLVDSEGKNGDMDGITLERDQIWEIISTKHNLDGSDRYIHSIWDAYRALNGSDLPGLQDDFLSGYLNPGFKVTKLDRIFISHGVYADRNNNGIWDPGEEVGFTIKDGVARAENLVEEQMNKGTIPGSYIILDAKNGKTGQTANDYTIHVVETVTGMEEGIPMTYSFEFDTYPDSNGEININMPPEEYNTTMSFSFGGDEKYLETTGFELTSQDFYEKIDPDTHSFASYSITLTPKTEPSNLECCCTPALILLLLFGVVMTKQHLNYRKN